MSQAPTSLECGITCFLEGRLVFLALLELFLEVSSSLINDLLVLGILEATLSNKLLSICLRNGLHLSDGLVHAWLSEGRLIHLVVAVLSEPDHIEEDILSPLLPIPHSKPADSRHAFHIVSIDTDDGSPERLHDIGGEWEASGVLGICCEADLVICDKMNASVCGKFRQFAKSQSLIGCSLPSKSSISVSLEVEYTAPILLEFALIVIYFSSSLTHRD